MDDLTGHPLGAYRVLDRNGAGGMATVYRAYHAAMDRYVAIKVLPRHLVRDPDFRARFIHEAPNLFRSLYNPVTALTGRPNIRRRTAPTSSRPL